MFLRALTRVEPLHVSVARAYVDINKKPTDPAGIPPGVIVPELDDK